MRGLGIGIIVTSLLMGYSNKTHATSTKTATAVEAETNDADNSSLTLREHDDALNQEETESVESTDTQTESVMEEITEVVVPESVVEPEVANETEIESEPQETKANTSSTHLKNGDKVIITVNTGEGSGTVARKLENAGVIDNASEFDAYLMQHGYDKSISRGDHEVIVGSSWMDIAKQMTKSK